MAVATFGKEPPMSHNREQQPSRATDPSGLRYLGSGAVRVLCAVSDSMFPPSHEDEAQKRRAEQHRPRESEPGERLAPTQLPAPPHASIARYLDRWLAGNDWPVRLFIKLFWLIFELTPVFFVLRLRRFSSLDLDGRVAVLNAWSDHWFYWCRMAATLLKSQVSMAYFADPSVRSSFRIPASPLSGKEFLKWRGRDE